MTHTKIDMQGLHPAPALGAVAIAVLGVTAIDRPASAQTFDQAALANLKFVCDPANNIQTGPNLFNNFCNKTEGSVFSSVPSGVSPRVAGTLSVEQRLQSVREAGEDRPESRSDGRAYAFTDSNRLASDVTVLTAQASGGNGSQAVVGFAPGLSGFVSAGAAALYHHNNRFEDGYESQVPTLTLGGDYRVNDWLLAGLAFNYTYFDGTYDDGGGFAKNGFGPLLYATFLPSERTFVDVILGYARQENTNKRAVVVPRVSDTTFSGHTSGDYSENQYSAAVQAGYDQPIDNFTIGPRLGFAFSHSQIGSFNEDGDTGLELRYRGLNQTSAQSSLGVQATAAFYMSWGVVIPQANIAWVHEYANDARNIQASLIEA